MTICFYYNFSSNDIVTGYDFVVNSVWPEVVANLEARTPSIFAPGNPNIFHEVFIMQKVLAFAYLFSTHLCRVE